MGTGKSYGPGRAAPAAIAALTAVAFFLRLLEIDQSLYGDESFTYRIVTENGPGGILSEVANSAITPPFHYLLAWLAAQVGDPTVTVRLPSLILGTCSVPLVYALGVRTVGKSAAVVGSAIVAIAPFAVFYGVEARGYATLMFLSVLSSLVLLRAVRKGEHLVWLGYWACVTAILYTHYSGVFVVLGQAGWALWAHRDRVRQLAIVYVAVALAYAPWLPSYFTQRDWVSIQTERFARQFPLSLDTITDTVAHVLPGYPDNAAGGSPLPLGDLPGRTIVALVWGTIGVALAAVLIGALLRRPRPLLSPPRTSVLIVVLALVTPLGVILYSVQPDSGLLFPRNLSASLPAFALLVGWLLTSLRPQFAVPAVALMLTAVGIGTVKALDEQYQRPAYRQVADLIDDQARPGDAVVNFTSGLFSATHPRGPGYELDIYFDREHELFAVKDLDQAWARAANGRSVFFVSPQVGLLGHFGPLGGPQNRFVRRAGKVFPGLLKVAYARYSGELRAQLVGRSQRRAITWSLGDDVEISPGEARGAIDAVSRSSTELSITGWAADGSAPRGADWVLAFSGGRLLAWGTPTKSRPDVAKAVGTGALTSGFTLTARKTGDFGPAELSRLRVFAIVGEGASELRLTRTARRSAARSLLDGA